MKRISIYAKESKFVYEDLFIKHLYEIFGDDILVITKRDESTGEETQCAAFKVWDYFLIEED